MMDATQSQVDTAEQPDSWEDAVGRLNDWALRITRVQREDLPEVQSLCMEAFVSVLRADAGWMWVTEREQRVLASSHGLEGSRWVDIDSEQIDALWFGIHQSEASETAWLLNEELAEELGPHALAVPIPTGGHRMAFVLLCRKTNAYTPMECQIANTLMAMTQGALASAEDRAQMRCQQRDLAESLAESQSAVKAKSQFLATMSHEIRTPMNGILGMTQLLMDTNLDAEQREFLNTVRSSAKSLLTIINDVLDFSKVDAGRLQLDPVEFDVVNMLEEVMSLVSERADPKGLDLFSIQPAPIPSRFVGDEGRIRQILINLVGNAVKFTLDGQVVVRTTVDSSDGDNYTLRFEVEDTGIGIAPEKVGTLFESFVQADNSTTRRFGGTGLGLAISKRLVELLGGEFGVRSEVGMGSTFWFTVPIERVNGPSRTLDFAPELRGKRLWVGAENPLVAVALRQVVANLGVQVHGFRGQGELMEALAANEVDYVVLDDAGLDWTRESLAMDVADQFDVSVLALLRASERDTCRPGDASPWTGSLIRPFRGSLVLHTLRSIKSGSNGASVERPAGMAEVTQLVRPTKVLLAEDSPVNRTIAIRMLKKVGFHADVVHNGLEAVEACKDTDYDIVLMDCLMPVVDGYQATQRIRKYFGGRRGPVIVALTANAMADDRAKCIDAGMDDYLAKPFSPQALADLLEHWIAQIEASGLDKASVR